LGLNAELKKSSGGRFEIYLNGEVLFSKAQTMRFPETEEVINLIKEKIE